jgi:thymidylate synthase
MDNTPFIPDKLETGNRDSNVAVCTLWTEPGRMKLPKEMFAVRGNLYSGNGIRYLLRNLLANPMIRYLVICGNDRTGSGDDLASLFKNGIDRKGRIRNSKTALDENLTQELVDRIRKNVELIDMRGRERDILKRVKSLGPKPPHSKPVIVEEIREPVEGLEFRDVSGFRLREGTIPEAWLKLLDVVMKLGEMKKSEHGLGQKEVLNTIALIDGDVKQVPEWMPFSEEDLDKYYDTFFGSGASKGLSYTYGKRLFEYIIPGSERKWEDEARVTFNQVENALKHLKKTPYTRRATVFTWYVHKDSRSENPPCLTQITWNVKYGKLFQTAVFRSHDIFGGWPMNAFALRELQKRMASELKMKPGTLTIISNSAHIYENNFPQARDILSDHYTCRPVPFGSDRLGHFLIGVEKGEIVVRHAMPDGKGTEFVFRGKDATGLYRTILNENLVSRMDHAAYLGMELARAECALKSGRKYVQG